MAERARETVELMNMCMIRDPESGKVLVMDKRQGYRGRTFPGGHLEPGEAVLPSVVREIREETGLTVEKLRLCGVKDWMEKTHRCLLFLFATEHFSGALVPDGEEGPLSWITLEELRSSAMAEGFEQTLRVFLEEGLCELYVDAENRREFF